MNASDIAPQRLANQFLLEPLEASAAEIVARFGAVQAQDFFGAKWALAQRMTNAADTQLDDAFNAGEILRTHILRPTWHFVARDDLRWMLALSAPRVHATNAFLYRKLELDDALFKHSRAVFEKTLRGGKQETRGDLARALKQEGIQAEGMRLAYLVMHAELEGVLCSGARRGKQFTYALLAERAPRAQTLEHEHALHELTRRYFLTRGPAAVQDFAWWSGLTVSDVKRGIESCKAELSSAQMDGQTYWFAPGRAPKIKSPRAHLLPNYDEYFIGFRDRRAIMDPSIVMPPGARDNVLANHIIFIDGKVAGGWRRALWRDTVAVEMNLLRALTRAQARAVLKAANAYAAFLGVAFLLRKTNENM